MITLYTKPMCPFCVKAKDWLQQNNIAYTEVDISENETAREMLKEHGHKTVPQIYFNGKLFVDGGYTGLSKQDPSVLSEQIELEALRG